MILATLAAKPKRKPNLVRWMIKHRVSGNLVSLPYSSMLAVEREAQNKENERPRTTGGKTKTKNKCI